mmetsp:Transcript_27191/g.68040  ORF Transcript_27191/g.68040 Transcript_27191/m.68040 type:complete len:235 (+) Transcript_27191:517-1221(+)
MDIAKGAALVVGGCNPVTRPAVAAAPRFPRFLRAPLRSMHGPADIAASTAAPRRRSSPLTLSSSSSESLKSIRSTVSAMTGIRRGASVCFICLGVILPPPPPPSAYTSSASSSSSSSSSSRTTCSVSALGMFAPSRDCPPRRFLGGGTGEPRAGLSWLWLSVRSIAASIIGAGRGVRGALVFTGRGGGELFFGFRGTLRPFLSSYFYQIRFRWFCCWNPISRVLSAAAAAPIYQ